MNKRWLLISVGGVIVGVFATGLLYLYASQLEQGTVTYARDQVMVMKAADTIVAGTVLSKDLVFSEGIPERFLPPAPLLEKDLPAYVGRVFVMDVEAGAMILTRDFGLQ